MSELEVIDSSVVVQGVTRASQFSFADLEDMALAIVDQGTLEKQKRMLMGVCHAITRVTYRIPQKGPDGILQRGYVSLEARIADAVTLEKAIKRGRIKNIDKLDDLPFSPDETIVYNDGGTGIRRQVTMTLYGLGMLDIGERVTGDDADFDAPWTSWASFAQEGREKDKKSEEVMVVPDFTAGKTPNSPLVIMVRNGLRISEYNNGVDSETFYLS